MQAPLEVALSENSALKKQLEIFRRRESEVAAQVGLASALLVRHVMLKVQRKTFPEVIIRLPDTCDAVRMPGGRA
jgi:hypothetical protein